MPTSPPRPCTQPGCPNLVTLTSRCPQHRPPPWTTTTTSAHTRGYGTTWRRTRVQVLRREPDCRYCGQPATEVDHIIPLHHGGTMNLTNLQPLCHQCHTLKTTREAAAARTARRPGEG